MVNDYKKQIQVLQLVSIIIVLLFLALSTLDCIYVHCVEQHRVPSDVYKPIAYEDSCNTLSTFDFINVRGAAEARPSTDTREPRRMEFSYNNQFPEVLIVGGIQLLLVATNYFRLNAIATVAELLLTIVSLCRGYIHRLLMPLYAGVGSAPFKVTFEISAAGWLIALLSIANVIVAIEILKKSERGRWKNLQIVL